MTLAHSVLYGANSSGWLGSGFSWGSPPSAVADALLPAAKAVGPKHMPGRAPNESDNTTLGCVLPSESSQSQPAPNLPWYQGFTLPSS